MPGRTQTGAGPAPKPARLTSVPEELCPAEGESAVLSLLAARTGAHVCQLAAGSLLTVPTAQALLSWRAWARQQPLPPRRRGLGWEGFDLGPVFEVEPFPGVIGIRRVVRSDEWRDIITGLERGEVGGRTEPLRSELGEWSLVGSICADGDGDAHHVVAGAKRPVRGIVAGVTAPAMPHSEDTWQWQLPTHEPKGRALAEMLKARRLLHWPRELLGVEWNGLDEFPPPAAFVVGKPVSDAWIVDMWPGTESGHLVVTIGWDATRVDPLGLVVAVRVEHEGVIILSNNVRISDLPPNAAAPGPSQEPRALEWNERTIDVAVPRGPGRTAFGAALYGPDGSLLDERRTAPRYEKVTITFGTHPPEPSADELAAEQRALELAPGLARELMTSARAAAAGRRLASQADLFGYLCWRFSCVAGDLLVLDAYLIDPPLAPTVALLKRLDRPIRALSRKTPATALRDLRGNAKLQAQFPTLAADLAQLPSNADVRLLPHGTDTLHDRVWIVGDTGLLVGGSVNTIPSSGAETTITELPLADVQQWRGLFEQWWPKKK